MTSQDKFLIIFSQVAFSHPDLFQRKKGRNIAKKCGTEFSALRLRGVRRSRSLAQTIESLVNQSESSERLMVRHFRLEPREGKLQESIGAAGQSGIADL